MFIYRYTVQKRGFKTQRAIEAQLKRNPTFSSRLRDLFGMFHTIGTLTFVAKLILFFFVSFLAPNGTVKSLDPSLAIPGTSLKHNETLGKLLFQQDEGVLKDDNVS